MKNQQMTVLFFYPALSTFVVKDLELFQKHYRVFHQDFNPTKKWLLPWYFVRQLLFLFWYIGKADLVVSFFSHGHSLFPAIFSRWAGKPFLIIAGGTDCVYFPSISYGNYHKRWLSYFTRKSFALATHVAVVHKSLARYTYSYFESEYPEQGFEVHTGLQIPFTEICNGYDASAWKGIGTREEKSFITVAGNIGNGRINQLKGIDLVLEAAKAFPDCRFYLVGANPDFDPGLSNVIVKGRIRNNELPDWYGKAQFYMQLSISEGFPNALSEAMLCGCVPIGSNVGGIPDIIGDTGFILKHRNKEELFELIKKALQSDLPDLSVRACNRIAQQFPNEKREQKLVKLIDELVNEHR